MEEDKIIFLGTAGDSIVTARQNLASGGIIVKVGEVQLHIDPGPGALVKAVQYQTNVRANTAVLVSNNSIVSSHDVNAVIDAMTYAGLDKTGVLIAASSIINGSLHEKQIIRESHKSYIEKIIVAQPHLKFAIEDVEIHSVPAFNKDETAVGFKILAPRFTLGYISPTRFEKELIENYKDCDIIIFQVAEPGDEKSENSLNSSDVIKIALATKPKLAIITGFGYKMLKIDPLNESRRIQKEAGVEVLLAKDGFSINPWAYSANSKQRRLNSFVDKKDKDSANNNQSQ